ncbi:ACT domain-containing protein [Nocardioides perillae]|uniref:Aspartate kinase n=1 Tax=Nocardioides perillae TaxID=1119534 RepID=A0A7Y9UV95_9ACTN|nr:ACT domain-containing protein [Nocardioides perillae]NYG56025.1 hypothetical protein [Nocardioides perillae]
MSAPLTLARFPETLALVRLAAGSEVPSWVESSSIFSVTATAAETALVCAARSVPTKTRHVRPFTAFSLVVAEGTHAAEAGHDGAARLLTLLAPLVEEGLGVRTVPTYDTDWVLVPTEEADRAEEAWRRQGHTVAPAVPATRSAQQQAATPQRKSPR